MRARAQARGFTLTEMMVSLVVTSIVMIGVLGAMSANQKQFVSHSDVAEMQSTLRSGSTQIERALALAGFGIDPNFALEPFALTDTGAHSGNARDGSGPHASDELVVHYADPRFRREVTSVTSSGFTLATALEAGDSFPRGTRLAVVCPDASDGAYVTVESATAAGVVTLMTTGAPFPFNEQADLDGGCFSSARTFIRRIERRHFYIAWFEDTLRGGTRPALMVNRGLDLDGDGTLAGDVYPTGWPGTPYKRGLASHDSELVALDVEQLQVAYVMNRPNAALTTLYGLAGGGPDSDKNWIYGDDINAPIEAPAFKAPAWSGTTGAPTITTAGVGETVGPPRLDDANRACQALLLTNPDAQCSYGGKRRYTGHVGNSRMVRFTLLARLEREDAARNQEAAFKGSIENLQPSQMDLSTRHKHQRLSNTVTLRNIFQRTWFVPPPNPVNVDGA